MGPLAGGPWEKKTPWRLDTAKAGDTTLFASNAVGGRLCLRHEETGQKLVVPYTFYSVGVGRGAALDYAACCADDPGEGVANVRVRNGREFGPDAFPCLGYIVSLGATTGPPSLPSDTGTGRAFFLFGFPIPFGGIGVTGWFSARMPATGPVMGGVAYGEGLARGRA